MQISRGWQFQLLDVLYFVLKGAMLPGIRLHWQVPFHLLCFQLPGFHAASIALILRLAKSQFSVGIPPKNLLRSLPCFLVEPPKSSWNNSRFPYGLGLVSLQTIS